MSEYQSNLNDRPHNLHLVIKEQIGGKKNFRGPEIFGGDFLGKCKKGVGKLFWGVLGEL